MNIKQRATYNEQLQTLRRDRKAALRECGHLGDKLHTSRLETEVLRHKVRELERKLSQARAREELLTDGPMTDEPSWAQQNGLLS
jgi:predicted  nucleic acid-binding Zn-ribbon protein